MVDVGQRIQACPNLEYAKGFVAGVELVNDSAIRVKSCTMDSLGVFRIIMDDEDYDSNDYHPTEHSPVAISMEVLRGD